MKAHLLFTCFLLQSFVLTAQFGAQRIISSETNKAYFSIPLDIDNDGFVDVLSAQADDWAMVWFRNTDGLGNFAPKQIITDEPSRYISIDFVDMNSDGYKDILFLENNPREVRWIEHLDGAGTFGDEELIYTTNEGFIKSISTFDADEDGDLDILLNHSGYVNGDKLTWLENLDGSETYSNEQLLIQGNTEFYPPILEDIDNDGDIDILTSLESYGPSTIVWFENSGNLSFPVEHEILSFQFLVSDFTSVVDLQFVDIDSDEMKDVFFETDLEGTAPATGWLKNMGGTGEFGEAQNIIYYSSYPRFYDLDKDGANDMLGIDRQSNLLFWVENTNALGSFNIVRNISDEIDFPRDAQAADFDNDGLLDVVSASLGDDTVAWYKNTGVLGVNEAVVSKVSLYPNPTSGILYIENTEPIESATLYNVLGTPIKAYSNPNELDLSEVSEGIYFVYIRSTSGSIAVRKVMKR